jgi:tetratricopeptide (TPR) repeat protein
MTRTERKAPKRSPREANRDYFQAIQSTIQRLKPAFSFRSAKPVDNQAAWWPTTKGPVFWKAKVKMRLLDALFDRGDKGIKADDLVERGWQDLRRGRLAGAVSSLSRALSIYVESGDTKGQATANLGLGCALHACSQYQRALRRLKRALQLADGDIQVQGQAFEGIGNVLFSQGDFVAALDNYRKSLDMARECGDTDGEGMALGNLMCRLL